MVFALAGNQNCGKTTLFNSLTGSNQHVGNFPGVTVDRKSGQIRNHPDCEVVDLPGIYSIRPYTGEEIVTRDFLIDSRPDGIINIIDATNIERNLYLTLQLLELQIPTVIALNMMDEVRNNGGTVNVEELSKRLGIPVVPIAAVKNEGVDELVEIAVKQAREKIMPQKIDFCGGAVHRCVHAITHLIEDHAKNIGIPPRFAASKIIEDDPAIITKLKLDENEYHLLEHSVSEMEHDTGLDRNAAMADMRYTFIESVCADTVIKCRESKEHKRSVKIDSVLTNKYLAIPLFLVIMLLIFFLTFEVIGAALSDFLALGIDKLTDMVDLLLTQYGLNPVVHSMVIDGIFAGVGSVLSFLPTIVTLFFFLSLLEDSGYMARVAFVMDSFLRKIGLSGRSFVPMLIGFGCTVPAVMATRTLPSERDRRMTVYLTPFISCSAKMPIYAAFTMAFFSEHRALIMAGLYVLGIVTGILFAIIIKPVFFKGNPVPFVMELPNYRLPGMKNVCRLMWDKAKDFIERAFTVIFAASLIIWFLQSFDLRLNPTANSESSLLALLGRVIAPVFAPLGFDDWRAATSLITGFTAKEAVVSSMTVLLGGGELSETLKTVFSPLTSVSFLVFTLLYTPCVASVAAVKRELGSGLAALGLVVGQCIVAWIMAFIVYHIGLIMV